MKIRSMACAVALGALTACDPVGPPPPEPLISVSVHQYAPVSTQCRTDVYNINTRLRAQVAAHRITHNQYVQTYADMDRPDSCKDISDMDWNSLLSEFEEAP